MSAYIRLADATRNATLDAITARMDAGAGAATMKVYTGTIPTNANTAIGAQVLLGTLTFTDPSAGAASAGVWTASAITQDGSADASGTIGWARIADSDGTTIMDVSAGTGSGVVLAFNTLAITAGGPISCSAFTITVPLT